MSLAEVREQAFSPGSEKIHFPKMHEAIWQRFSIERPKGASAIWFLEFQSTRAKDILLAMPTPDGGVEYHQAGENFPDTAREVNFRADSNLKCNTCNQVRFADVITSFVLVLSATSA